MKNSFHERVTSEMSDLVLSAKDYPDVSQRVARVILENEYQDLNSQIID
jgi:hypothetical protein